MDQVILLLGQVVSTSVLKEDPIFNFINEWQEKSWNYTKKKEKNEEEFRENKKCWLDWSLRRF